MVDRTDLFKLPERIELESQNPSLHLEYIGRAQRHSESGCGNELLSPSSCYTSSTHLPTRAIAWSKKAAIVVCFTSSQKNCLKSTKGNIRGGTHEIHHCVITHSEKCWHSLRNDAHYRAIAGFRIVIVEWESDRRILDIQSCHTGLYSTKQWFKQTRTSCYDKEQSSQWPCLEALLLYISVKYKEVRAIFSKMKDIHRRALVPLQRINVII